MGRSQRNSALAQAGQARDAEVFLTDIKKEDASASAVSL
jgi:hypothetical protein